MFFQVSVILQGSHSTWKTWKNEGHLENLEIFDGILKNLIFIMEKWHETWKNLRAIKIGPMTPLKQYFIH